MDRIAVPGRIPDIRPDTGYFRHMIDMIEENSMKISHLFIKTRASKSIKSEQNVFIFSLNLRTKYVTYVRTKRVVDELFSIEV